MDRTDAASLRVEASSSRYWSRGDFVAADWPLPVPDELFGEPILIFEVRKSRIEIGGLTVDVVQSELDN